MLVYATGLAWYVDLLLLCLDFTVLVPGYMYVESIGAVSTMRLLKDMRLSQTCASTCEAVHVLLKDSMLCQRISLHYMATEYEPLF